MGTNANTADTYNGESAERGLGATQNEKKIRREREKESGNALTPHKLALRKST